jgi:hypothetical protein
MVKIKRVPNPQSPKTPRGVTGNPKGGSFHDESQLTRKTTSARTPVKKLHVKYDKTTIAFTPVEEQFTNNLNPRFDPSKDPGSVRKLDGTPQPPKGFNSGHQKVIKQTDQMRNGGKTIIHRP